MAKNKFEALYLEVTFLTFKRSHHSGFIRKDVLRNFVRSTEKHLENASGLQLYQKRDSGTGVFENTLFTEHLWVAASEFYK